MSAEQQEPLPAIRMTHYATARALEALEKEREADADFAAGRYRTFADGDSFLADLDDLADEAAFEASVQHRLSDLQGDGTFWTYGEFAGVGPAIALATQSQPESDTGAWEEQPDEHLLEPMESEAAARTEATRRNWPEAGEG